MFIQILVALARLAEEEREDVEKKVGEALDENLGFAIKSTKSAKFHSRAGARGCREEGEALDENLKFARKSAKFRFKFV
jgi:hypothetical protein